MHRIEALDVRILAAMAADRFIPGPVNKPFGGRLNPCAMVTAPKQKKRKSKAPRRQPSYDIRPITNRRIREMDSPFRRVINAYLRGEIEAGQELTRSELRERFSVHYPDELQLDLAFVRAPFRLVSAGYGMLRVRAA